jgi:hypothetical protein
MHTPSLPIPPPLPPGTAPGAAGFTPSLDPVERFDPLAPPAFGADFELAPARVAPPAAAKPRGGISAGTALWGFAAAAAVAYLSVVLFRPDLVARVDQNGPAVAEIEALRGEMDTMRRDMSEIRSSLMETASQQKVLFETIADLHSAATVPAAQTDAPPPAVRIDGTPAAGALAPRAEAVPQSPAAKVAEAKVLNAKPSMETGSVKPVPTAAPATAAKSAAAAAEPPPFEAPVVTPSAQPVGVQIASGSSLDSLRLSWNLLSETHADKLKSLEPRYSLSVDNGAIVYNLLAGPVKSEADAKKMCKSLAAKAVPCKVVGEFGGASL